MRFSINISVKFLFLFLFLFLVDSSRAQKVLIWSSHQLTPRTFKLVVLEYCINMIILLVIVYFFLEVKNADREGWAYPNITLVSRAAFI